MPSWWPFSAQAKTPSWQANVEDRDVAPAVIDVHDTEYARQVKAGELRTYGDKGGPAIKAFDRAQQQHDLMKKQDMLANVTDVESITSLTSRYHDAFVNADAHMRQRLATAPKWWEVSRRDAGAELDFAQWRREHAKLQRKLEIHWMDDVMDHPVLCLRYCARVSTTAGAFFGLGRTAYLYRTMDKTYAKLNGVSIWKIALHEVSYAVLLGAGVAVVATIGANIGTALANLLALIHSRDVVAPQRSWVQVTSSVTLAGFASGVTMAYMARHVLTPWGMRFVTLSMTTLSACVGLYAGYVVYRPFAAKRTHTLYEPYWRPWSERAVSLNGGAPIRGRYT